MVTKIVVTLAGLALAWDLYFAMLGWMGDRRWVKPAWVNVTLVAGVPIQFGVGAGLVSRNPLIGLLFATPLVIPIFIIGGFIVLWICEQQIIRNMSR